MDEFVCVRMIQFNGVDLAQFQFDYDMSFGVLFLNADGTVYGRYGTRNDRPEGADKEISMEGLRAGMEAALALHRAYPANAASLAAKRGSPPKYARPELYPQLQKYTPRINYGNQVAKSCIHCHQVHNAQRQGLRDDRQPIPDEILYPYPMPQVVGISLDPKERATVSAIEKDSPAVAAGMQPGDEILVADGQPLISVADFQWILHQTSGGGGMIPLEVNRSGQSIDLNLELAPGWRKRTDFTWRVSTWDLRRMALGGMVLQTDESGKATPLGLSVKGAGKYGNHAVARRAGVREGDQLVSIAGLSGQPATEAEVIAHVLDTTKKGDPIRMTVRRQGKQIDLTFRTQ